MALVTKNFSDIITFTRTGSTATYFNSAGVLTSAAADQPRFDYNPSTLAARGLLIEEQRTNLAAYSAALNDPLGWTPQSGLTVTANAITAPDGTISAERLASDGINTGFLDKTFSITSGTTYTFSCFFKKHNTSTVAILLYGVQFNSGGANVTGSFNLDTGVATGVNGTAAMTPVGNGWYRCSLTKDATTTGAFTQQAVRMASSTGDVYAWGYQIEAGAFPTSYIPTTVASATRNADVASVNTLSPWYNSTTGTIYAEYSIAGFAPASAFPSTAALSDGTGNNRINLASANTGASLYSYGEVQAGGAPQAGFYGASGSPFGVGTARKVAIAYAVNDFAFTTQGLAVQADPSGTVPTVDRLYLGVGSTGTAQFQNGYLRRITYYPRRLTNAELQAITT